MKRMNKKGQELSINTLITVILGIVIVFGGIAVVYKFINSAQDSLGPVNDATRAQLEQALKRGEDKIVAVPQSVKTQRKETAVYSVGVINQNEEDKFKVDKITFESGPTGLTCNPDPNPGCPKPIFLDNEITVPRYESFSFKVGLFVPKEAPAGQYVYRVKVNNNNDLYASKKIYLTVN